MTDRVFIDPDLQFIEGIIQGGGEDLKKCFQCATCTVVCPLSPDGAPFPRKEMITAQWGIKDKLLHSMDPWLCFHCGDCSEMCPRGAKPGDVMAAIRNMIIANVSVPSFIGKATQSPVGALALLLVPIILLAAVIAGIHGGDLSFFGKTPIDFSKNMIPQLAIELIFIPTAMFAVVTAILGVRNLIGGFKKEYPPNGNGVPIVPSLVGAMKDVFSHGKFKECGPNQERYVAHLMLFYAFIGLLLTTLGVTLIYYINLFSVQKGYAPPLTPTPLPFLHPIKILGNLSALAALSGIGGIVVRRLFSDVIGKTVAFDWIFIGDVLLIILTGILAQVARMADMPIAYFIYFSHLVFVFFLFAYAPHSKFGHMFYRTAALVYARYSGRDKSLGGKI